MSKFNFAISLVTLNNYKWTKKTLDSLFDSDILYHDFTLFIFNNKNKKSDTLLFNYISEKVNELKIRLVYLSHEENLGIVIPRIEIYNQVKKDNQNNKSYQTFDYLLEIHDDMIFPRNWLNQLLKHDNPKNAIISPIIFDGCYSMDNDNLDKLMPLIKDLYQDKVYTNIALSHPCITRLDVLEEIGYYNPLFSPQMYEDTDLHCRLLDNGYNTVVTNKSIVFHSIAQTRNVNDNATASKNKDLFEYLNKTTESKFLQRLENNGSKDLPYRFMPILDWKYWCYD